MPPKSTIFGTLSGDLTERAAKSLALAREETRRLSLQFVGTEHLLLGILGEGTSAGALLLQAAGLSIAHTRTVVERKFGRGSGVIGVEMPFTPRARYAWEIGFVESEDRKHPKMHAEHILFGIIRESLMAGSRGGGCSHILKSYDIDIRDLEKQVVDCLVRLNQPTVSPLKIEQQPTLVETQPEKQIIIESPQVNSEKPAPSKPVAISSLVGPKSAETAPEKLAALIPPRTATPNIEKHDWPPIAFSAGIARSRLGASLLTYVDLQQLGQVAINSPVSLVSGDVLSLDILYVSYERLQQPKTPPIPELAVLIAEHSNQLPILRAKLHILLASGTHIGLLIEPTEHRMTICAGTTEQILEEHEILELPALLPGYALAVRNLWFPQSE